MGADRNQWLFPPNEAGKVIGWSLDGHRLENKDLSTLIGGVIGVFDTRTEVTLSIIFPGVDTIRTGGYSTAGDGGGALYKRVASEPSHVGKVRSANGIWFEIAEEVINLLSLGLLQDGTTDETDVLQTVATLGKPAFCNKPGTAKIAGTVTVGDGFKLTGCDGFILKGIMNSESTGGYPNLMFTNADTVNGNTDITFENVEFDFAKGALNYANGAGLTSQPSFLFAKVDRLTFRNCSFFDFVTNHNSSVVAGNVNLLNFGMARLDECSRVKILGGSMLNIREEGWNCYSCEDIEIAYMHCDGTAVVTSSFAGIWNSNGVHIHHNEFIHNGGSVMNVLSSNVLIEHNRVNYGVAAGGYGFNITNQIGVANYACLNVTARNNYVNTTRFGFEHDAPSGGLAVGSNLVTDVFVYDNTFSVTEGVAVVLHGVRLLAPKNAHVYNNTFLLGDASNSGIGASVQITSVDGATSKGIHVYGNSMTSLCGVRCVFTLGGIITDVFVHHNTHAAQNIGALLSAFGASTFFNANNAGGAVVLSTLNNLDISDNVATNLGGGGFSIVPNTVAQMSIAEISMRRNKFYGPTTNGNRMIHVQAGAGTRNVIVEDNLLYNGSALAFAGMSELYFRRNISKWPSTLLNANRCTLTSHNGVLIWEDNYNDNVNTSFNDLAETTPVAYTMVSKRRNTSRSSGSTYNWQTSLTAANTLPNSDFYRGTAVFDPASLAAAASVQTTVTVTGAALGMKAEAYFSITMSGLMLTAEVTSANTVTVTFTNPTAGVLDIGSGTLTVTVARN